MPYAYLYAGRHGRTCEVVRFGMRSMFHGGRGGLPGNDNSGGTLEFYMTADAACDRFPPVKINA